MKVNIKKYKPWIGPYQLASALCFWARPVEDKFGMKSEPDWVHKFGEFLAYGSILDDKEDPFNDAREKTWLYKFLIWINEKRKRKEYVKIDPWDTWSMDHTLALIILPMLKQLKETKQGSPCVDQEDVPENLRMSEEEYEQYLQDGQTDEKFFERWDYVMDEMIFAFTMHLDDSWEDNYTSGEIDFKRKAVEWDEDGKPTMFQLMRGPNDTYTRDWDKINEIQNRIDNGFKLFGKYYRNLWD